jgi:hypothetical protein
MKYKIYILSYNDHTKKQAEQTFQGLDFNYDIIKIPTTKYLENVMYCNWLLEHKYDWTSYDYVGTLSWKSKDKIDIKQIPNKLNLCNNIDVMAFFPCYENLIKQGTHEHGINFKIGLTELLTKLGFTEEQIFNPNVPLFLCNYWMTKPSIMMQYIVFFHKAKNIIENDIVLKEKLYSDGRYANGYLSEEKLINIFGFTYYPLYIFLLERLPCYFFYYKYNVAY